jgi:hypothetical protein
MSTPTSQQSDVQSREAENQSSAASAAETPEAAVPLPVDAWKMLVESVTKECRQTNYFLSRDEERGLSDQSGWSDWNDRMSGYDAVDGAEASGRYGRDRALTVLAELETTPGEAIADAVARAVAAIEALPDARGRYGCKGVSLVVRALRRAVAVAT